jgi:hypothetical protein
VKDAMNKFSPCAVDRAFHAKMKNKPALSYPQASIEFYQNDLNQQRGFGEYPDVDPDDF